MREMHAGTCANSRSGSDGPLPSAGEVLANANNVAACALVPRHHRRKYWFTKPLERVNTEIKRRASVVCMLQNDDAVLKYTSATFPKRHGE